MHQGCGCGWCWCWCWLTATFTFASLLLLLLLLLLLVLLMSHSTIFRYWRSSQANCESTARKTPSLPPSVVPMKLSSSSSLVGGLVPSCTCIITHQRSSPSALIIIIIISSSSLPSSSLIPHPSLPPLHRFSPLESPVTVLLQVRSGRYTSRTQSYAATCTSY